MNLRLRPLLRAIRLTLTRRIDCAPRFDSRAPYPELDNMGFELATREDMRPVVVVPINRHTQRVYYGPGPAHFFVRYTAAWHEDEARALADAWGPLLSGDAKPRRR